MAAVWYRPLGTKRPGGFPSVYHVWYRQREDGHLETTASGRTDWLYAVPSLEFSTLEAFLASGVGYRVKKVGSTVWWDEDLDMDEGL